MILTIYLWREGNDYVSEQGYLVSDPRFAMYFGNDLTAYTFKNHCSKKFLTDRWELFRVSGLLEKAGP